MCVSVITGAGLLPHAALFVVSGDGWVFVRLSVMQGETGEERLCSRLI